MQELTSVAIRTVSSSMELSAKLCFVIRRKVDFLNQFMLSMCERTLILKLATSGDLPIPAHLCLLLHLILSDEIIPLLFALEVLLRLLQCSDF